MSPILVELTKTFHLAIKPAIAALQKSKTPVPQGSWFLQIEHSEV
jgi:hypothetical protein